jgi:spore maturation protein CgeB
MKVLCVFGRHNYGSPERGEGYEYVNFIPALRALGCQVEFFESLDRTRHRGFGELNGALVETVRRVDPDIIFFVLMHFEIWTETLDFIRTRTNAVLLNWATDDSWKYRPFSRYLAPHFDIHATTSGSAAEMARRDGLDNFVHTQWAASGFALREPLPAERCRYPVTFVGSNYGNRAAWVNSLRARGIEVSCFGHGWPGGAVAAGRLPEIIRESIISLNFGDSGLLWDGWLPRRSRQIKARVFEVPGSGGFLMTEAAEDLDRYFAIGREIETFASRDELARKIRHYLAHPGERDDIAAAGHQRVRREHTYEVRFQSLLERAGAMRRRHAVRAGSAAAAPALPAFENIAGSHRVTPALRLLRQALLLPCIAIWGTQRGPRAARRILYELSWRLAGAVTYSARGWPGRLFFRES